MLANSELSMWLLYCITFAHIKELIIQNLVTSDSFMHSRRSLWKTWSSSICLLTTLECMGKPFKKTDNIKTTKVFVWRDATTPKKIIKKRHQQGTLSLLTQNYKDSSQSVMMRATSEHHIDEATSNFTRALNLCGSPLKGNGLQTEPEVIVISHKHSKWRIESW